MKYKNIIIKIGSNVLTNPENLPDEAYIAGLARQIAALLKSGSRVTIVSSGAVAAGRSLHRPASKLDTISQRQLFAATGQPLLMQLYYRFFAENGHSCAQVLVTKEDFRDRNHYLNMKNCLSALLQEGIVPVINENDVVAVTELMFTDNDELSGLVATMLNADALFILTNVDGVFSGDPALPGSRVIPLIGSEADFAGAVTSGKSMYGRGGMLTKCRNALKVAGLGINVHIASGRAEDVLARLASDSPPGTLFPANNSASSVKKWVAHSGGFAKGAACINAGAARALHSSTATSLLPVGVVAVQGTFQKGDIIEIRDEAGRALGYGMAACNAEKARQIAGQQHQKPLVHYDYLYLEEPEGSK